MPKKTRFQTRLDMEDAGRVEDYTENHGVTQSEAVRRLIQQGLDAEEGVVEVDGEEIKQTLHEIRADGGQMRSEFHAELDRLRREEELRERNRRYRTITSAAGMTYVVLVALFGFTGLASIATGVLVLGAHVAAHVWLSTERDPEAEQQAEAMFEGHEKAVANDE